MWKVHRQTERETEWRERTGDQESLFELLARVW